MHEPAFRCPLCEQPFQVEAVHRGQAVACPHCGQAVAIPAESAPPGLPGRAEGSRLADREPPPLPPRAKGSEEVPATGPATGGAAPADVAVKQAPRKIVQVEGQAYEIRSLTPEERARFRRRVNWIVCGVSATLVVLALGLLLWWQL